MRIFLLVITFLQSCYAAGQDNFSISGKVDSLKIRSIPASFLIDPTGRIIAKDLRGKTCWKSSKSCLKGGKA